MGVIRMNIEKTREYYENIGREDICSCIYCRNFIDEVRSSYPETADFLSSLGVDIEKPFEVFLPSDPLDGYMDYYEAQYLIAGDSAGFSETRIGDISVYLSECHPQAVYKDEHFIIGAGVFRIKCRYDKYSFD